MKDSWSSQHLHCTCACSCRNQHHYVTWFMTCVRSIVCSIWCWDAFDLGGKSRNCGATVECSVFWRVTTTFFKVQVCPLCAPSPHFLGEADVLDRRRRWLCIAWQWNALWNGCFNAFTLQYTYWYSQCSNSGVQYPSELYLHISHKLHGSHRRQRSRHGRSIGSPPIIFGRYDYWRGRHLQVILVSSLGYRLIHAPNGARNWTWYKFMYTQYKRAEQFLSKLRKCKQCL